ncbi:MAG: SPOR domain-containing protein [Gammaproteobacteria bacterium]|nr:SPOR domain-containing protein [Gammaproteobacteria bacterium]MCH9716746.1 SPOR domain-containing protein [Gammaproteobacteria bacterium]MCH9764197.1 SPOR domain-containing protein [Gammaproteobacteria bacterium]
MAKDRNIKKSTNHRATETVVRRQSKKHFFIAVLMAFFGGYALALFYAPAASKVTWLHSHKGQSEAPFNTANTAALPKPNFEFYTLLTQEKKPIKSKLLSIAPTPKARPVHQPESKKQEAPAMLAIDPTLKYTYLLQVASFQRKEDAEQMKASLIMRGFDANIKSANQPGGVWHRVVIGPFVSRQKAEKAQAKFVQIEHISGIIRRMDA